MYTKLIVTKALTLKQQAVVEAYWQFNEGYFVNTPRQVASMFKLSLNQLQRLIGSCSAFEYQYGSCVECNEILIKEAKVQVDIAATFTNSFAICSACHHLQYLQLQSRKACLV